VWNSFTMKDTDGDGRNENTARSVMRDWFNLLSMASTWRRSAQRHPQLGRRSGRHACAPWSGGGRLARPWSGAAVDEVMTALEGTTAARDIVVTNGPMIAVTSGTMPAIGRQVVAGGGTVTLTVTVTSPEWADIDTLEIFANDTPKTPITAAADAVSLQPIKCFTSRTLASLAATDPCAVARLAPESMTVSTQT
jgi:hypothetical protein